MATSLEGSYWKLSSSDQFGKIEKAAIVNISLAGCCLFANPHSLTLYDRINLIIRLDDTNHTRIQREATVCRIVDNHIGCRFATKLGGYEPALGLYLKGRLNPEGP